MEEANNLRIQAETLGTTMKGSVESTRWKLNILGPDHQSERRTSKVKERERRTEERLRAS